MSAIPSSLASLSFAGTLTSSVTATQTSQPSASSAQAASALQAPSNNGGDFVQLTEAQQVEQLYSHGRTVPQIASNLNLSVQAVNNYLSISQS